MKKGWIGDVEVFPNFFCVAFKEYGKEERLLFEISQRYNDAEKLYDFLVKELSGNHFISFNGIHYDVPVLLYFLDHVDKFNTENFVENFNKDVKWFSDMIISTDFWWKDYPEFKYHNFWTDIDLYLYWSRMLRISKKISLKGLGIQLKYPVVQDLPYPPDQHLSFKEMDDVIEYNKIHDLNITELVAKELSGEIKLRMDIQKEMGFDCLSWDAIKLASEALLKAYCDKTGEKPWIVKKYSFKKESLPDFSDFNPNFKNDDFQRLYNNAVEKGVLDAKFIFNSGKTQNLVLSFGVGGLHSINKYETYRSNDSQVIKTSDVASLYPTIMENYKLIRFPEVMSEYSWIKDERLIAKKQGIKTKNLFYKLILNGTSGLLDNTYSWLYFPENATKLRIIGQLMLSKLIEAASPYYRVISANTDGIELIIPTGEEDNYYNIVKEVEEQFNIVFEHENYDRVYYKSVNDYIAVKEDGVNAKLKGDFVTNPPLGNSTDFLIIPKLLNDYFIRGTDVQTNIYEQKDIFDFCASKKVDRTYTVIFEDEKQQQLNRYYASTSGSYLYKIKEGSISHMLKDSGVTLYNIHNPDRFPEDINYAYYIKKVNEVIHEFERKQLSIF